MGTSKSASQSEQKKSPVSSRQIPERQTYEQRQPEHAVESSPSLQRYLGNSYVQAMATTTNGLILQKKLIVNQPGDIYEQEADRIADQVMATPAHAPVSDAPLHIQRFSGQVTGQVDTAPPSVDQILASPGTPLEPTLRQDMEQRFGHDFSQVRIHTDASAARSAELLRADAYTFGTHIAFANARFLPGTEYGNRLMAHELTHTIQQARLPRLRSNENGPAINHRTCRLAHRNRSVHIGTATSPHIALRPASGSLTFAGMRLGTNHYGEDVRVKREVGATQGYDDRLQAIAIARLHKAEPAAVAQSYDGKWHALETTANFYGGLFSAADTPTRAVYGLPSSAGIADYGQQMHSLQDRLGELDAMTSGGDRKAIEREREQVFQDFVRVRRVHASLILGVPDSEIRFTQFPSDKDAGKINISWEKDLYANGTFGPVMGQRDPDVTPKTSKAIEIRHRRFKELADAQSTLFHEAQHMNDDQFSREWVENYEQESGRTFVSGPYGEKPFIDWLNAQVAKKRLTAMDVELIVYEAGNYDSMTEARANVRTFLAAIQAGNLDLAIDRIVAYAGALTPSNKGGSAHYATPPTGSRVKAALVMELKTAYRRMPKAMQQQYNAAVAAAKKAYPNAWISELDFSKKAGR